MVGPLPDTPFSQTQISPLKLVPKKQPGEFRLIHNLSHPYDESSVNGKIPAELATVSYATIQDAISIINQLGSGCFMAKSDIKSAFRIIPIAPEDHHLLGFQFEGQFYYDTCLAMGCSSSCGIFEKFSTALHWIMQHKFGVKHIVHVLDDFLFLGLSRGLCQQYLNAWKFLCRDLGVPLSPEKTEDPSQTMVFLGIELSTYTMTAQLPVDKLRNYAQIVYDSMSRRKLQLQEMQSIVGCLQFATSVVTPGKAFLRRLINTMLGISNPFHYVTLNIEAKKDLVMWQKFLRFHNGKTIFKRDYMNSWQLNLHTDASHKACAAVYRGSWFVVTFPSDWKAKSIAFLELYPIMLALHIFGVKMANKSLTFFCDNKSVCEILNKQSSKVNDIMVLVRTIVLICMQYNIHFKCTHLGSKQNFIADALSRLQISPQQLAAWKLRQSPESIPPYLLPANYSLA